MNLKANKQMTGAQLSIEEAKVYDAIVIEIAVADPFLLDLPTIRAATGLSDTSIVRALNRLDETGKIILRLALQESIDEASP